ncbi:MAG: hypothetical protein JXJ04_17110, partial [Spirochaetales bacterium]|nr:hypothetical protein [Spirochaetales bacterium]
MDKKKILILEDESGNFLHLKSKLKNIYDIFTIKKEHDIVEALNDFPRPDIILLYKEKDGTKVYKLLKFLSRSLDYSDIAVIVISEKGSRQDKIKVLTEGAVDCVTLPVVPEEVAAKIESIIRYKERCLERHSTR